LTKLGSASDAAGELERSAQRRIRLAAAFAALAGALVALAAGGAPGRMLDDLFQRISPGPPISRRVHVVVIDPDSLRALGGWPWSRYYLARLTDAIADRGAVAIGFDMLFPEPDRLDPKRFAALYGDVASQIAAEAARLPSMDAVFARTIGRHPVVLGRAGVQAGSFDYAQRAAAPLPPEAQFVGQLPRALTRYPAAVANLSILDGAALGHGLVNGDRDPDGVVRRVPLIARVAGQLTAGFALELARVAEGADTIVLEGRGGRVSAVRTGRLRTPATADGELVPRFADWRRTQTTSAADVMRQGLPGDLFKGQVVIVGLASAGASDAVATPASRAVDSVYVQAQAVDALLRGQALRRPDWAGPLEWALGLALAATVVLAAPRRPDWRLGAAAAAAVVVGLGGAWLAFLAGRLIDPLPILAPAAGALAIGLAALAAEARLAQAQLRAALDDERDRAAAHQQLLIQELNHRVKNTLATVQSIAMQTSRHTRESGEIAGVLTARVGALARAHDLLSEGSWRGADLADVVTRTLAPYVAEDGSSRLSLSGPPIALGPNAAVSLHMAFHELAANAAKFGALSTPDGRVAVAWRLSSSGGDHGSLELEWRETGGAPVAEPLRRGFGSRLLEQALAREFDGEVTLSFPREGAVCRMRLPLSLKLRAAA
jgi:two-component sensor histidine kinase/CHASE2 domain-containing sensor protein